MKKQKDSRNFKISDFYCTKCGLKNFPIIRTTGKEREPGHLKKMFCFHCGSEQNMVEIKTRGKYLLEDFWIEYEYHNFDENGNRIEKWGTFVSKVKQEMIKNEKEKIVSNVRCTG